MSERGYYRFPALSGQRIVFVADDDLWEVGTEGGAARRLTAGQGPMSHPRFSPDGRTLVFVSQDGGDQDLYRMPAEGGPIERLTYTGGVLWPAGFLPDGRVAFSGSARIPFAWASELFAVDLAGGTPTPLQLGPADAIAYGPGEAVAIGRHTRDGATWKRYRGGTAGELWLDARGSGDFTRIGGLDGNPGAPFWVQDRLYFLADHEGIGNLYSLDRFGQDLRRHTDWDMYYARNASSDGLRVVYHLAGDLYLYDPGEDQSRLVDIRLDGQRPGRQPRLVRGASHLTDYDPHPHRSVLAVATRGQTFTMGLFGGPVERRSPGSGVRVRLTSWLTDDDLVGVLEQGGQERLVRLAAGGPPAVIVDRDLGPAAEIAPSPDGRRLAVSTLRRELYLVDVARGTATLTDQSAYGFRVGIDEWKEGIRGLSWSRDSRYVAYALPDSPGTTAIRVADADTATVYQVTEPLLEDRNPVFDPEGRYLYFLGKRDFTPVMDQFAFDMGFPSGLKPYAIALRADVSSPFLGSEREDVKQPEPESNAGTDAPKPLHIDFEGILGRLVPFPVSAGLYDSLVALKDQVLWIERGVGEVAPAEGPGQPPPGRLQAYSLSQRKLDTLADGVEAIRLSRDAKTMILREKHRLRRVDAGQKVDPSHGKEPGRESGVVDLERVTVPVDPPEEWAQILREAWRLMRENYWSEDMAGIDWEAMYQRYAPLVARIGTRSELSDILWELQGELGTSHAYEFGGDHRPTPPWHYGGLGCNFLWSEEDGGWRITDIVQGDPSTEGEDSPLRLPGINGAEGDILRAVDGIAASRDNPPDKLLLGKRGQEVSLLIERPGERPRSVVVKTLARESLARYRAWVLHNRDFVWARSGGRVGYLHIPDMMDRGFAEFHRLYLSEVMRREALVVDVRHNGGGQLSPLFLEKLARRRLGFVYPRIGEPVAYPYQSPAGPIVAVTNEYAGSDGDMFSHAFKLMGLGPLVGHRTWGGVVGINPELPLIDGGLTTQPEFAITFLDVGLGVENYGTDPTIPVDNAPQDYRAGRDRQLERAVDEALALLEAHPAALPPAAPRLNRQPGPLPPRR